jgi:hypothetical protein
MLRTHPTTIIGEASEGERLGLLSWQAIIPFIRTAPIFTLELAFYFLIEKRV